MASAFGHAIAALAIGTAFTPPQRIEPATAAPAAPRSLMRLEIPRWWLLGAVAGVLPDADVIGFSFGVNYVDFWGHRGFTHSLVFAAIVAAVFTFLAFPRDRWRINRASTFTYLFLAGASHGLLDMLTNGGLGVALFAPFNNERLFFPWQPIQVSPIGVGSFFTAEGLAVIRSELVWIVLPSVLFATVVLLLRRRARVAPVASA
jgi:inner membrane protein